ncbi:MAG: hypothetical protein MJZ75_03405 [Paludibacteraceae bacterium]|nr:hypothetical protein [Paludibacteraceae bacterium]
MMKRICLFLSLAVCAMTVQAGITTYTFTNAQWASQVGATRCDGTTDGWISDLDGNEYSAGFNNGIYQHGVKVGKGVQGAGATSVKTFTNVRRVTFNLCQNSGGKGKGTIYVQVGENMPDSIVMTDQQMADSRLNRDSIVYITTPNSGQIKFWVNSKNSTGNAIYISSVSIRYEGGEDPAFTQDSYQLVTDIHRLRDSDQVIIGIADGVTNRILGYFDEAFSDNNIQAIKGVYSDGRTVVAENEDAVYTLWKEVGEDNTDTVYIFQDELRYEQAYLVANGGRTKNKLTVWSDVYSPAYGNNGFWRMNIAADGTAIVENAGTSERKYMQYNASNKSFGCYADPHSQTKVCLYRKVPGQSSETPAIAVNMVNFGNVRLSGESVTGQTTTAVNANRLSEEMTCSLKHGDVFTLSANTLDRDGDMLTIRFTATAAGKYTDTLVVRSGALVREVSVMVNVVKEMTVAEATQCRDFDFIYLNPVVVTKKYDSYVFVRDVTGSMLIYDAVNPDTGKPYAQGLENGHVLSNIQGRYRNYYGVPEMTPTAAWAVAQQKEICTPETVTGVDSADVCRYVQISNVTVESGSWQGIPVLEKFQTGSVLENIPTILDAIVMIDHDETQLWVVKQTSAITGNIEVEKTLLPTKFIRKGQLYIRHNDQFINVIGQ